MKPFPVHTVLCRHSPSVRTHSSTARGEGKRRTSSSASCGLPWWNWTINISPNLPSLSVTTLQPETCFCPLILYQQLFSPLELLLHFSTPLLPCVFTCSLGFNKEKSQALPAWAGLYFSVYVTTCQWLLDKVVCAACLPYPCQPLSTLTWESFAFVWMGFNLNWREEPVRNTRKFLS